MRADAATCKVFISHAGKDSGKLAGFLFRDLRLAGLDAFLDEDRDSIPAGSDWPEQLRQGVATCSVFIVLVSPGYFIRSWPVAELHAALERAHGPSSVEQSAPAIILPAFVGWNLEQAKDCLRRAAAEQQVVLHYTSPDERTTTIGSIRPPPAGRLGQQRQAAQQLRPAQHAWQLLQQLCGHHQQATTQHKTGEHAKLRGAELVKELVERCLTSIPKDFKVPEGVSFGACRAMHPSLADIMNSGI